MNDYFLSATANYCYDRLDIKEKGLYRAFLHALLFMHESMKIQGRYTKQQVVKVSEAVVFDRPDVFWFRGSFALESCNDVPEKVVFEYVYTQKQRDQIIYEIQCSKLYKRIDEVLRGLKTGFEKALRLYELIIQNAEYEVSALQSDSPVYDYAYGLEGIFLKRRAVCAGYARAFAYFACRHNVWCTIVNGKTQRGRHAWNLIRLDGEYYYIDATWGDPVFANAAEKEPDYISYDYFCITTAELLNSHKPILDVPMPTCTATKYNYYRFFGMLETQYSVANVAQHIVRAVREGKKKVYIKYATLAAYQTAERRLFEQNEIFDALKTASRYVSGIQTRKVNYNLDEKRRIISVRL